MEWLSDPTYLFYSFVPLIFVSFFCCLMVWFAENRTDRFVWLIGGWFFEPIAKKIVARRKYVVERNKKRKRNS